VIRTSNNIVESDQRNPSPRVRSAPKRETLRTAGLLTLGIALLLAAYQTLSQKKEVRLPPSSFPNFRVEFFDQHSGVIIGPRVFHTKDAGRTWSIIDYVHPSDSFKAKDGPAPAKYLVDFVDPDWAWRVSPTDPESVEYSVDGAQSWTEPIKTGVKARTSLVFVNREVGWVLGDVTVFTRDGGKTWRQETALSNLGFAYPYFLDANHGWIANYWGIIAATSDGGQHWNLRSTSLKQIRSIFFLNAKVGWAVGENGLVAATENGGADWMLREAPVPVDSYRHVKTELLDVFFINSQSGWIVGQNGLILFTKNGGKNWLRASTPTNATLSSVRFTDAEHGWAVGGHSAELITSGPPSNVVLETNDGGQNWIMRSFEPVLQP